MMATHMASIQADAALQANETETLIQRFTKDGRELWYKLRVLQQPIRARACGSGQKAASDRRPVDPPPVIELKIYEGKPEEQKEITFDYKGDFFLFASLQHARAMAHGRGMPVPQNTSPVLTGVAVAGVAYLDRPSAAGYFIFPDLSVRHEGVFKLTFSLYETIKDEMDRDRDAPQIDHLNAPGVDWRMEVSTEPFSVFSAKKFPGLMESTNLSKCVADQGCRVRIRRDIRMRKRDGKGGRDGGRRDDEPPRQRTVTPATEDPRVRARSISGASETQGPYLAERRPSSVIDAYPPPPPRLTAPGNETSSGGHLAFGDVSNGHHHHYATPRPPMPLSSAAPNRAYGQSPHPQLEPAGHHPLSRPSSRTSLSSMASIKPDPYHQRQLSGPLVPPSPAIPAMSDHAGSRAYVSSAHHPSQNSGPAPLPSARNILPALESKPAIQISNLVLPASPPIQAQLEPPALPVATPLGGKRKHELVFTQHATPLHNGQRQAASHFGRFRTGYSPDSDHGFYQRADGQFKMVHFPQWY